MKNSRFNPLALIGLIGFLGLLGFFTDNTGWFGFFGWFIWLRYIKRPVDERFSMNFSKAGRNGFFISLICFAVLIVLKGLHMSTEVINITLASSFILLTFGFLLSFSYYERLGE